MDCNQQIILYRRCCCRGESVRQAAADSHHFQQRPTFPGEAGTAAACRPGHTADLRPPARQGMLPTTAADCISAHNIHSYHCDPDSNPTIIGTATEITGVCGYTIIWRKQCLHKFACILRSGFLCSTATASAANALLAASTCGRCRGAGTPWAARP